MVMPGIIHYEDMIPQSRLYCLDFHLTSVLKWNNQVINIIYGFSRKSM